MAQKAADQVTLVDLTDAYSVILTSEASTIPAGTTNALQTTVTTQVIAMRGDEQMTATVTAANISTPTGVTAAVNANSGSPIVSITVGTSVTASGVVKIPVVIGDITIYKDFSFSLALRGATGNTGAAGKGISSTAITYQASSSGTTAPTGTWTTTIPTLTAGQFLWTRTILTYTDSTTATLYSVGRSGVDGAQGVKGDTGANGQTSYFHVAYATNATGTTGFSTTDPTGKTYIGTYTDFTSADSTDPTKYEWALIKGADGSTGATGKGITSSVTSYQAHTDGTTAPTGTWAGTIPAVPAGQFLWTRLIITFSDGATQTSYTVAKQGETGQTGAAGADAITLSVTSSAGLIFKNSDIVTTLTATVFRAGTELTSAQVAAIGTVRWYKDGNSTSVGSGLTLSITAGQVTNRATYTAQLED